MLLFCDFFAGKSWNRLERNIQVCQVMSFWVRIVSPFQARAGLAVAGTGHRPTPQMSIQEVSCTINHASPLAVAAVGTLAVPGHLSPISAPSISNRALQPGAQWRGLNQRNKERGSIYFSIVTLTLYAEPQISLFWTLGPKIYYVTKFAVCLSFLAGYPTNLCS